MFKRAYFQNGLLSIFYSCGSDPLKIWGKVVQNGHIKRVADPDVNSMVLELDSCNITNTYIQCPKGNGVLSIKLPCLVLVLKNMEKSFSFEVTVLDHEHQKRKFRVSNHQINTTITPFRTNMPMVLSKGWNQVQFNLADITEKAYGKRYVETLRIQINANVRLRRIYFSDRSYSQEELPQNYKLYTPLSSTSVDRVKRSDDV